MRSKSSSANKTMSALLCSMAPRGIRRGTICEWQLNGARCNVQIGNSNLGNIFSLFK